ncbi:siderophore-interacting protein [Nocardioides sp. KIGAM211]|uniref:Siderophore-interacting protein n=2 Tax=Nocardioides luti TaxID=2761101 RepID=A0A7X0RH87_9ACTN|nr:siderophore-interacting protein [Nocardioides luti]
MILDRVAVAGVRRLSPSFVRIELAGPALAEFGVDGPLLDQRIKLLLPGADGSLPSLSSAGSDEGWYAAWLALPETDRGHLRTYTVRALRGSGADARLVVDVVLHPDDGEPGPGASWAARAVVGDEVVLLGPRRGVPWGGIEFLPGDAATVLLAGDETAVPAVCAVLEQLPPDARGAAFLEVPVSGDVLAVEHPVGVEVVWLPRDGRPLGSLLQRAVLAHLGSRAAVEDLVGPEEEVDPDLWETPTYSSAGEAVAADPEAEGGPGDLYAWVAGESRVVTGLRRALVAEVGLDRRQVAFMGYWRRGVAMRS